MKITLIGGPLDGEEIEVNSLCPSLDVPTPVRLTYSDFDPDAPIDLRPAVNTHRYVWDSGLKFKYEYTRYNDR